MRQDIARAAPSFEDPLSAVRSDSGGVIGRSAPEMRVGNAVLDYVPSVAGKVKGIAPDRCPRIVTACSVGNRGDNAAAGGGALHPDHNRLMKGPKPEKAVGLGVAVGQCVQRWLVKRGEVPGNQATSKESRSGRVERWCEGRSMPGRYCSVWTGTPSPSEREAHAAEMSNQPMRRARRMRCHSQIEREYVVIERRSSAAALADSHSSGVRLSRHG